MIILTNCLTEKADEGCLKVAVSLIRRIKAAVPDTTVISYGDSEQSGDLHLNVNKFMLSPRLLWLLWRRKEPVLYVPAVAKGHTMSLRVFILSLAARRGLRVVQVMRYQIKTIPRLLLKLSRARIITLSRETWDYYREVAGEQTEYLKTGVDTQLFQPVTEERKRQLRQKYGLPQDKPIVLHVGHMRPGRNVSQLLKVEEPFRAVLVASTYAPEMKDTQLRDTLLQKEDLTILEGYLPEIQEIYQLSDVYLFPVERAHSCIDVPLSAMEAAACGLPVVTTAFGELKELLGEEGFYEIGSFEPEPLNALLKRAYEEKKSPRASVMEYDWNLAAETLLAEDRKTGGNET